MQARVVGLGLLGLVLLGCGGSPSPPAEGASLRVVEGEQLLMGTRFHVQAVVDDESRGVEAIEAAFAEVQRVEALLSEWQETSEISAVNRTAGGPPVEVGPELLEVVERSLRISELTEGAFDVTFAGCGRLWSMRQREIPDPARVRDCLSAVGYDRVELDAVRSTIRLRDPKMRIGIAGIGKGYGVDRAAAILEARGLTDYVVDGGGDLRLLGRRIDRPWRVGIAHPRRPGELFGRLALERGSIVTSGDYERSFEQDGVLYHHILDPATGMPARRSIAVTVTAPDAMQADALATGLFVMGPERGLELVERIDGVEALWFGPEMAVRQSSGFPALE